MTDEKRKEHFQKTIQRLEERLQYHKYLHGLTNHSKRKDAHQKNILFILDVIALCHEDYEKRTHNLFE